MLQKLIENNKTSIFVVAMVLLFCGVMSGCSAFSHGSHYAEYKNRLLPLSTPSGINRLEQEANYDSVLGVFTQNRQISSDPLKTLVNRAFQGQNQF